MTAKMTATEADLHASQRFRLEVWERSRAWPLQPSCKLQAEAHDLARLRLTPERSGDSNQIEPDPLFRKRAGGNQMTQGRWRLSSGGPCQSHRGHKVISGVL
jgi:hypothetical protein